MSDVAVVCPHCGAVHPDRDERESVSRSAGAPGGIGQLSRDEAAALLSVSGATREPAFWRDYVLPHRSLEGALVLVDLFLIVLTLPLIAGVVLTVFWGDRRDRVATVSGSYAANMGIALVGGVVLLVTAWSFGLVDTVWPIAFVGALALLGRVALAATASRR